MRTIATLLVITLTLTIVVNVDRANRAPLTTPPAPVEVDPSNPDAYMGAWTVRVEQAMVSDIQRIALTPDGRVAVTWLDPVDGRIGRTGTWRMQGQTLRVRLPGYDSMVFGSDSTSAQISLRESVFAPQLGRYAGAEQLGIWDGAVLMGFTRDVDGS